MRRYLYPYELEARKRGKRVFMFVSDGEDEDEGAHALLHSDVNYCVLLFYFLLDKKKKES